MSVSEFYSAIMPLTLPHDFRMDSMAAKYSCESSQQLQTIQQLTKQNESLTQTFKVRNCRIYGQLSFTTTLIIRHQNHCIRFP